MENRYADLFRIIFMLNCLILFLSFTGVKSAPMSVNTVIDVMKNDPKLCPTSKFIYDSNYIKPCASIAIPTASDNYTSETLNSFLCLGVYDTAYKICHYSSQKEFSLDSTATFNSYVEKYIPNENMTQENFCNSLQGFTSLYDKINILLKPLITSLNKSHECSRICFDFRSKFQPLCAVFAWIKNTNADMMRSEKKETKHGHDVIPDKSYTNQSKNEVIIKDVKTASIEFKKIEIKESKEQDRNQITADSNNNNNNNNNNINDKESNPLEEMKIKSDGKKKSDTEKTNNIQKKLNISLETQTNKLVSSKFKDKENIDTKLSTNEVVKPIKESSPNSDSQGPMSNAKSNINKNIVNEENIQKSNKEQNIDDVKPSTLSENTQDHYDAANPEGNMENDIDDVDDTIQHPDTGNQNENVQEVPEQKNNVRLTEYSNIRTEDDSHFFTYFTVITLACLAGYIGYHNKQKIFAIVLEGRRSRNNRGRRRPSTANYRKLDCTLEEAVTSQCNANVTHVIY